MADEIQLDPGGDNLLSSAEAAARSGFTRTYISRLCKSGELQGRQVGGIWYVSPTSLAQFMAESEAQRQKRREELAARRTLEYRAHITRTYQRDHADALQRAPLSTAHPTHRRSASNVFATSVLSLLVIFSVALPFAVAMPNTVARAFSALTDNPVTQSASAAGAGLAPSLVDAVGSFLASLFHANSRAALATSATYATSSGATASLAPQQQATSTTKIVSPPAGGPQPVIRTIIQPATSPDAAARSAPSADGLSTLSTAFDQKLASLRTDLLGRIASLISPVPFPQQVGANGNGAYIPPPASARIDQLNNTTITNPTITGGSIAATSITGTISNAITSALATIDALTSTTITATNVAFTNSTTTNATTTNLYVSGSLSLTSPLSIANGGTGTSTAPSYGKLLLGNSAGTYDLLATSSLGISGGSGTPGGSANQVQFNNFGAFGGSASFTFATSTGELAATAGTFSRSTSTAATSTNFNATSLTATNATLTNLSGTAATITAATATSLFATTASSTNLFTSNLSIASLSGFLKAVGGVVQTALVDLASNVTGILPVGNGGTGWAALAAGAIPYGNGSSALATTTAGTSGQVLALLNGVPTWTATTTFASPLSYASGIVSLSTSGDWTGTFDGQEGTYYLDARNLANFGSPFFSFFSATTTSALAEGSNLYWTTTRFDNRLSATTTLPNLTTLANLASVGTITSGTWQGSILDDAYVSDALTISGGTVNNTPIGATTPSTAVFTNSTSTSATSTGQFATNFVATNATTSFLFVNSLLSSPQATIGSLAATSSLTIASLSGLLKATSGIVSVAAAGTDYANFAWPFTASSNFNTNTSATSTALWAQAGLYASSTSQFAYSTTTAASFTTASTTNFTLSSVQSALLLANAAGTAGAYAGSSCTNQFVRSINGAGVATCAQVSLTADVTGTLAIANGGTGTTTAPSGWVLYGGGSGVYQATATSSLTAGTALSISGTAGSLVGGTNLTINFAAPLTSSLSIPYASSTAFTASNLFATNATTTSLAALGAFSFANSGIFFGLTSFGATATTTVSAAGTITTPSLIATSATSTNLFAANAAASTGSFGATATSSFSSAGALTLASALTVGNGGTATTTFYSGGVVFSDGTKLTQAAAASSFFWDNTNNRLGVGTSTPWAQLSVNPNGITGPSFVIGSSTATWFTVSNGGNVGVGTTTPGTLLSLGNTGANTINISPTATSTFGSGINIATGCFSISGTCVGGGTSGAAFPFTPTLNFGANTNATSTALSLFGGLNASSTIRFGNAGISGFLFDSTTGFLGLGTTTPWAQLSINPNGITGPAFVVGSSTKTLFQIDNAGLTSIGDSSGTGDANFQFAGDDNAWSVGYKSSDKSFNIASSTNLTGTAALSIAKNGNTTIVGSAVTCTIGNGSSATNCSSSDARLKTDVAPLQAQDGLAAIMALNPVSFEWNAWMQSNGSASTTQYGFIAQDVQNVFPTLVSQDAHSGYYKLDYQGFAGPTVKAIQELNLKLEDLATTTSTSTDSTSFTGRFFSSLFARITAWLADATNAITTVFADTFHARHQLCVDASDGSPVCVTGDQLKALFTTSAANVSAASSPPAQAGPPASDNTSPSSPTLVVNGNDPAQLQLNAPYQDNLGALFTHDGFSETVYSTSTVDVAQSGTSTLDYWAVVPSTQQWLHATRAVVVSAPTDSAPPAANDNPPPIEGPSTSQSATSTLDLTS